MKSNLSIDADARSYISPVCEVILVETQGVICASATETVGETEGEW